MSAGQGMMMSEPPSGGGGGADGPTIGNYKGVMLCNRPFAGTASAAHAGAEAPAAGKGNAFVTGVVQSELGIGSGAARKERLALGRKKNETALTRHKRWLSDLQKTKDNLEAAYLEEVRVKAEKKRRFTEREAQIRKIARATIKAEAKGYESDDSIGYTSTEERLHCYDEAESPAEQSDQEAKGRKGEQPKQEDKRGKGSERALEHLYGQFLVVSFVFSCIVARACVADDFYAALCCCPHGCRPMWSMTEDKAEALIEAKEEEELEELLAFTKNLDFDKYIRDAEIQSMIDQVKNRITELEVLQAESLHSDDEGSEETHLEAKILSLTDANLRKIANSNQKGKQPTRAAEDDVMSVARSVMSEGGRSVRSIHSHKSLAVLAGRARDRLTEEKAQYPVIPEEKVLWHRHLSISSSAELLLLIEGALDVIIVTHKDDGGLRLGGKNTVSNLPYIHRNPAL
ncbi:unnamed protein product [Chrysoparadoxa australica]